MLRLERAIREIREFQQDRQFASPFSDPKEAEGMGKLSKVLCLLREALADFAEADLAIARRADILDEMERAIDTIDD